VNNEHAKLLLMVERKDCDEEKKLKGWLLKLVSYFLLQFALKVAVPVLSLFV